MGSSRKKKRDCLPLSSSSAIKKKMRDKCKRISSTHKRIKRRRSKDVNKKHYYELKDMRKLPSNDEAFCLKWSQMQDIIDIIRSRETPSPKIYMQWNKHAISFYLKMCTCFGFDYQHLEPASDDENENKQLLSASEDMTKLSCINDELSQLPLDMIHEIELRTGGCTGLESDLKTTQPLTQEMSIKEHFEHDSRTGVEFDLKTQLSKLGMSMEEYHEHYPPSESAQERAWRMHLETMPCLGTMPIRDGPLETGCYSPGTEPDHIPYHLYLLVKEADDILKHFEWHNPDNLIDLSRVEEKIIFFSTYFHSHLPTGWEYEQDNVSSLVADCDTFFAKSGPKYLMAGYTPFGDLDHGYLDPKTHITAAEMADVMSIIHSRKTPKFMELTCHEILFYCKLCSCFRIDYHNLEAASEDDVCLMNMGRNG